MIKRIFAYSALLYSLLVMSIASCSKNDSTPPVTPVETACSGTPGPLFSAVKTLIAQKCVGCHNASNMSGGQNFAVDCNIVTAKTRIKVRAVDEGTMPPSGTLPQADKNAISAWVNAGGRLKD